MPEDPAWWAVKELRREMEYIVLPSHLIRTGGEGCSYRLEGAGDMEHLERVAIAYDNTKSPALGRNLARLLRLRVCLDRVGKMDHEEE